MAEIIYCLYLIISGVHSYLLMHLFLGISCQAYIMHAVVLFYLDQFSEVDFLFCVSYQLFIIFDRLWGCESFVKFYFIK